ncbi:hypothetical protein V5O48_016135 [Marasmius crinis-equi]|uniref:Uncharacterized protein n=1 Tax=Marasmius crinis-equi TaxID=585013 RepID=A0ABR3ESV6_9AGAR
MSFSYWQIPRTTGECKDDTGKPKRELHPFSLILLSLWGAFIVGLLSLLHVAVTHGPRSARDDDDFDPSWTLITLPTILLTVFTQAHVPVTAFHLARIAVSALQNPNTTPNSWAELFWMADQEWTGPVGIVKTTFLSIRSRTRASLTYILFATTCAVALVTPVLLAQAFRVQQVLITQSHEIQLNAISFLDVSNSFAGNSLGVDGGIGVASWETGLSVSDAYNASLFLPKTQTQNSLPEHFFTSEIGNATAILPGLRLQGQCVPLDTPSLDLIVHGESLTTQLDSFAKYCRSRSFSNPLRMSLQDPSWALFNTNLTLAVCSRHINGSHWLGSHWLASDTDILFYHYTRSLSGIFDIETGDGLIQCNSMLSGGTASASGVDRTFTNFTPVTEVTKSRVEPRILFSNPLLKFLASCNSTTNDPGIGNPMKLRALGFQLYDPDNHLPVSSLTISESLWSGVEHYVASTANLWKKPNQVFKASVPRNVALYTRNPLYTVSAHVMLALWATLLAVATAWSYRRTFSASLNSYVASELINREKFLLEDVPIGEAGDNDRLKAPFKPVGLCSETELEQELKRRRSTRTI